MHNGISARQIDEIFDRLIDLLWIDTENTSEFLRGAMCAFSKILEFKRNQDRERQEFKEDLITAIMEEVDHKAMIREEKGGQTSFLS